MCSLTEFTLGATGCYGEDEVGEFHMVTLGFLLFEICFINYYNIS